MINGKKVLAIIPARKSSEELKTRILGSLIKNHLYFGH